MITKDPVADFEHDHARATERIMELRAVLARAPRSWPSAHGEISRLLEDLTERLLLHFDREEEGLFPYVVAEVPELREAVASLEASHDGICGALTRMSHFARGGPERLSANAPGLLALFQRFEAAYGAHAHDEAVLLRTLATTLDNRQRLELADLVRGL